MKKLYILLLMSVSCASFAAPYFGSGSLTTNSATFVNPGGSLLGTARQYYDVFEFTVDTAGAYTIEMSSLNTNPAGSTSNALDTYLRLYTGSFNPSSPGAGTSSSDDYTGTLTVLPGPYSSAGLTATGTGFTNAQPSSRLDSQALTTATPYFLVLTSFRSTDYVQSATTNPEGGPTGPYWFGINGPGNVAPVPEPASMAVLGMGVLALIRRRKKA